MIAIKGMMSKFEEAKADEANYSQMLSNSTDKAASVNLFPSSYRNVNDLS